MRKREAVKTVLRIKIVYAVAIETSQPRIPAKDVYAEDLTVL